MASLAPQGALVAASLAGSAVLMILFGSIAGAITGAAAALLVAPLLEISDGMTEPVDRLLARRYAASGDRPKLVFATVVGLGALWGAVLMAALVAVFLLAAFGGVEGPGMVALVVLPVAASVLTVGAVVRARGFDARSPQARRMGTLGWVFAGLWHAVAVSVGGGAVLFLLWTLVFGMGTH